MSLNGTAGAPIYARVWPRLVGGILSGYGKTETVVTTIRLKANPEAVWRELMTYEEVPGRPPFLLRSLLPVPIRTEGDKTFVGGMIHCFYRGGTLMKMVTAVEPPRYFEFEVTRQCLGIESCVRALRGSYEIVESPGETDAETEVRLTTVYRGHLRPRFFWRPLERLLTHQIHRHILNGMRDSLASVSSPHASPRTSGQQEPLCTTPPSHSRP
jgi:hypothetical protein